MEYDLITVEESDAILSLGDDWLDLDAPVKSFHIKRASVYVQSNWSCSDIVWSDQLTIPDNVKMAIAYYAYADFNGFLYGVPGSDNTSGKIKSYFSKIGSMSESKVYSGGFIGDRGPLGFPNSLMKASCTSNCGSIVRS